MINTVALSGRLTRDPELRYTGNGNEVVSFNLAVNRKFKSKQGEQEADFINCQAWRATAEVIANNLNKGSLVGVEGRLQTRNYQDNDNKTVYITEVVVDSVTFLESKTQSQNNNHQTNTAPSNQNNQTTGQNYQAQGQTNQNNTQQTNYSKQMTDEDPFESSTDISDDDLPF